MNFGLSNPKVVFIKNLKKRLQRYGVKKSAWKASREYVDLIDLLRNEGMRINFTVDDLHRAIGMLR